MHLNDVLNDATILPWVPNSYFLLVLGETNGGLQQNICILSTKFGE